MPNNYDGTLTTATNINNWLHYCDLDTPLVAIGTLLSNSAIYENACRKSAKIVKLSVYEHRSILLRKIFINVFLGIWSH